MEEARSIKNISDVSERGNSYSLYKNIVLRILSKMNKGYLRVILPDGEEHNFGGNDQKISADIKINSYGFFKRIVLYGDIGFGESYVDGDWDTDNITNVISWMILNVENNPAVTGMGSKYSPINILNAMNRTFHKFNLNTYAGSKKNISDHYDLNNDFFKLWLDESMTYSSAIYDKDYLSLNEAQMNKYNRICSELKIKPTDHVLEIGSGWGGFSIYAAENFGCRVTTVTISEKQYKYASDLIAEKKLQNQIQILLKDYRHVTGKFDKIVSIEMLEAVGHKFLPVYFRKINELLKPDGAIGLQVITSHDCNYNRLRKGVDWIQKHIFPGSLLPSIGVLNSTINKTSNLHLYNLKNYGLDYSKTLNEWRVRFNSNLDKVFKLNFNDSFVRKWNYYFSYCEAAFLMRNINVVQMIYTRPNNRNL